MKLSISNDIKDAIPSFKLGLITYNDITVTDTPQWLQGRFQLLIEEWLLEKESFEIGSIPGVKEWRALFKTFGTDPSRYRPSQEALIRRLRKDRAFPSVHTAADVNNYFSVVHEVPMGIYDLDQLQGDLQLRIGTPDDTYIGINGRDMSMSNKFLTADESGAFGSPIVDSRRSMVTAETKSALQIIYLRPSVPLERCQEILEQISTAFVQFNGGEITRLTIV
ncbi:MAG: B3/4 domain-containing protein [Tuberibacillus sp.]